MLAALGYVDERHRAAHASYAICDYLPAFIFRLRVMQNILRLIFCHFMHTKSIWYSNL